MSTTWRSAFCSRGSRDASNPGEPSGGAADGDEPGADAIARPVFADAAGITIEICDLNLSNHCPDALLGERYEAPGVVVEP